MNVTTVFVIKDKTWLISFCFTEKFVSSFKSVLGRTRFASIPAGLCTVSSKLNGGVGSNSTLIAFSYKVES